MALIGQVLRQCRNKTFFLSHTKNISLSSVNQLKRIIETKNGNNLIIEGQTYIDERDNHLIKTNDDGACILCSTGLDVKHTDVLILSQFLRSDGCMLPKRITGLCSTQQKRITIMVAMAQKAGLLSNLAPKNSKRDPTRRYRWKKFNTYFDETTIKYRYN